MPNKNGQKDDSPPKSRGHSTQTDKQLVDLTLRDMEEAARLRSLSDLELIAVVLEDDQLSLDPRVYELMDGIYPDWHKETFNPLPTQPRFISFAVPFQVAYDAATFGECSCSDNSNKNTAVLAKPCIFCASRSALFNATKDPSYQPEEKDEERGDNAT